MERVPEPRETERGRRRGEESYSRTMTTPGCGIAKVSLGYGMPSAGGYAAMTLIPANASVLTVEYKMNFVAPAKGEALVARGNILRSGRTLIVTQANVFALEKGEESLCAVMQQTIMVIHAKQET